MQILKQDVKNKILDSALKEFESKGYKKASIRQIAKNAGMTEGNIYRYFKGKESIFEETISEVYLNIMKLLDIHRKIHNNREEIHHNYEEYHKQDMYIIKSLIEVYKNHRTEMIILIDKSVGTKFENMKDEIIEMIEDSIDKKVLVEPFIAHAIAEGFVEGIISIFKNLGDEENFEKIISQYHNFYFRDIEKRLL